MRSVGPEEPLALPSSLFRFTPSRQTALLQMYCLALLQHKSCKVLFKVPPARRCSGPQPLVLTQGRGSEDYFFGEGRIW